MRCGDWLREADFAQATASGAGQRRGPAGYSAHESSPGFLDELRNRTSLAQVVGRKVMWDTRKSNQGKGDMWAPCPFHQEKSASFHVDDRKGFYYCFGCHAKGDAIGFVKDTENVGFMEAVGILAREAGMAMPERDPQERQRSDRRAVLADVMEKAVRHYRLQLRTGQAQAARDYLAGRGLDAAALERWEIGFAPEVRQGLFRHLTEAGIAADLVVDAGLAARPDDGGAPYDRFRGRIIFPIRDARGRCIALGGRAMAPNARAKYLNSPETALFDKGRSLYNHGPAREAAGNGQPLVVAEGYMDVIALVEAGFGGAVAPLGTAITEDQLQLMWRIHPEPIVALDGDTAGLRAAMRLIDLAFPLIEAGRSLRFCLLPEGRDPDDVIRADGATAMRRLVESAQPMVALLWRRATEGRSFDSPERRAALDRDLRETLRKIRDPSIRAHYGQEVQRLRQDLFGQGRSKGGGKQWRVRRPVHAPSAETRASLLAGSGGSIAQEMREGVVLAALVVHPALLPRFESELERLAPVDANHRAVQEALLAEMGGDAGFLRARLEARLGRSALEKLFAPRHVHISPPVRCPDDDDLAALCLAEELAKLEAHRSARVEIAEAVADLDDASDEGVTWRLGQAAEALARSGRSRQEAAAEFEVAPNGVRLDRGEREKARSLLDTIDFSRGGRRGH